MKKLFCAFGLAWLLAANLAFADTSGTIRGTVNDSSGAVLQSAKVSVTNEGTGEVRRVTSDTSGTFQFLQLPVGTYTLRVEQTGFTTYQLSNIPLAVNQVASFD